MSSNGSKHHKAPCRSISSRSASSISSDTDTFYLISESETSSTEANSEDSGLPHMSQAKTNRQSRNRGMDHYKALDLPSDFQILNNFGKTVNNALEKFKEPGSVPHDIVRKIIRQVTEHVEAENPRPSVKSIEWVAWSYCMKYPGLKQVNPMETLKQSNESVIGQNFKEWVSNKIYFEMMDMKELIYAELYMHMRAIFFDLAIKIAKFIE